MNYLKNQDKYCSRTRIRDDTRTNYDTVLEILNFLFEIHKVKRKQINNRVYYKWK